MVLYRSCFAAMRGVTSNGSWRLQALPPFRMFLKMRWITGSSHCSTDPPSAWGPSVNLASPGWRMRRRSKYEMGVCRLTSLVGSGLFQSESRNFCVLMTPGCVRA